MSGNILDTDINLIKKEALELIIDLDLLVENNDEILDFKEEYKNRYNYLYKTSTSLYNFIFDGYINKNFNKDLFQKNLLLMLNSIYKIQTNQMTQHSASVDIGEELASHYIPHLKK
jgi:hypothetical protein